MDCEYVQFEINGETHVGYIEYVDGNDVYYIYSWGEQYRLHAGEFSPAEPCVIGMEDVRAFVRLEKMLKDIAPHEYFTAEYPYEITREDMLACIDNIRAKQLEDEIYDCWSQYVLNNSIFLFEEDRMGMEGLPDLGYYALILEDIDTGYSLDGIEAGVRDLYLPVFDREYTEDEMEYFVYCWKEKLSEVSEEGLKLYRIFAEDLAECRNEEGLRAVAYGCYGGNEAFDVDWERSEECLLELVSMYDDMYAANSLGYIYYYGRTNGGVPRYDEAFRYFTLGYTAGIYESTYKLADMIYRGKGVVKNVNRYCSMLEVLEAETRPHLYMGVFENKFPDVALRLGGYYLNEENDRLTACKYFLMAQFAINRRMKAGDFYGDRKVKASIVTELAKLGDIKVEDDFSGVSENILDNMSYGDAERYTVKIEKGVAPGEYTICISGDADKLLLVLPEYGYCGFQHEYIVKAYGSEFIETGSFEMDDFDGASCYLDGEEVYEFCFDRYVNEEPSRGKQCRALEALGRVWRSFEDNDMPMVVFQDELAYEDELE